jgi:multidrug efflux pump subunit AcrB
MDYLGFPERDHLVGTISCVWHSVDDAIVEVENIVRRTYEENALSGGHAGGGEIGLVVATTFALEVFLPTAFSGIPGVSSKQFGWTVALAVLASLVVARMLTPMIRLSIER